MKITITDPALLAQLAGVGLTADLYDPDGRMIGVFSPPRGVPPPGVKSPFTEEEMAERRKQQLPGRPLADILRDRVAWDANAERDLAAVWLAAADRNAVTTAASWCDRELAHDPLTLGESRTSSVHRVAYFDALGIEYEVI